MTERLKTLASDTLTPMNKFYIKQTLMTVLATNTAQDSVFVDTLVHWYIADVITACTTKQDLYHLLPKPLHKYVSDVIVNPQEDEPQQATTLKQKHSEALEHIHIRLTEKLLEE